MLFGCPRNPNVAGGLSGSSLSDSAVNLAVITWRGAEAEKLRIADIYIALKRTALTSPSQMRGGRIGLQYRAAAQWLD
jgi:hypothetical protein